MGFDVGSGASPKCPARTRATGAYVGGTLAQPWGELYGVVPENFKEVRITGKVATLIG